MNKYITEIALLGTSKRKLDVNHFPEELGESLMQIRALEGEPEDAFYRSAALTFTYERAARSICRQSNTTETILSGVEYKPYMDASLNDVFTALIRGGRVLRFYAYRQLVACGLVVEPCLLPSLLERSWDSTTPEDRVYLREIGGERLQFVLRNIGKTEEGSLSEGELWELGTIGERKLLLRTMRKEDPRAAREKLMESFKRNTAKHREELLSCLEVGLSLEDEAFLSEVMNTDKGADVRNQARELLLSLEGSALLSYLGDILAGVLRYEAKRKTGTGLMDRIKDGLGKLFKEEKEWSYGTLEYNDEFKRLGFVSLSSIKGESDSMYLMRQIAECMPLSWWSRFLACSREQAAMTLITQAPFSSEHFDFEYAIIRFRDAEWAELTLKHKPKVHAFESLIGILSIPQREHIRLINTDEHWLIHKDWFGENYEPWGERFSMEVLTQLIKTKYSYYPDVILCELAIVLHPGVSRFLEQFIQKSLAEHDSVPAETSKLMELQGYMKLVTDFNKGLSAIKRNIN